MTDDWIRAVLVGGDVKRRDELAPFLRERGILLTHHWSGFTAVPKRFPNAVALAINVIDHSSHRLIDKINAIRPKSVPLIHIPTRKSAAGQLLDRIGYPSRLFPPETPGDTVTQDAFDRLTEEERRQLVGWMLRHPDADNGLITAHIVKVTQRSRNSSTTKQIVPRLRIHCGIGRSAEGVNVVADAEIFTEAAKWALPEAEVLPTLRAARSHATVKALRGLPVPEIPAPKASVRPEAKPAVPAPAAPPPSTPATPEPTIEDLNAVTTVSMPPVTLPEPQATTPHTHRANELPEAVLTAARLLADEMRVHGFTSISIGPDGLSFDRVIVQTGKVKL